MTLKIWTNQIPQSEPSYWDLKAPLHSFVLFIILPTGVWYSIMSFFLKYVLNPTVYHHLYCICYIHGIIILRFYYLKSNRSRKITFKKYFYFISLFSDTSDLYGSPMWYLSIYQLLIVFMHKILYYSTLICDLLSPTWCLKFWRISSCASSYMASFIWKLIFLQYYCLSFVIFFVSCVYVDYYEWALHLSVHMYI